MILKTDTISILAIANPTRNHLIIQNLSVGYLYLLPYETDDADEYHKNGHRVDKWYPYENFGTYKGELYGSVTTADCDVRITDLS